MVINKKTNLSRTSNYIFGALAVIAMVIYFYIVYRFSANIPIDDDFGAFYGFFVRFLHAEDIRTKMSILFESGNMHRLIWLRLNILLVYILSGKINCSVYVFLTSLFLLGTSCLLCKGIRGKDVRWISILVIALLLFNGQNFGNNVFPMSGIANIGSIFITLLSIYLLLMNNKWAFGFGLLVSVITIYSNGNGMLIIFPILSCLLIQKRIKEFIIFGILTILSAVFYFHGLDSSRMGGDLWSNLHIVAMNIFVFAGNNLWLPSLKYVSLLTGIGCGVVYLWGIFNKVYKKNLFIYAGLTFLFLTAVAVAAGNNSAVLGGDAVAPWRYRIYGSLFLILTSLLLINNAKEFHIKKMIYFFPLLALFFSVLSTVYCYRKAERRFEQKMITAYHWYNNENKGFGVIYPEIEDELISYLKESERMGLYKMPQYPIAEYKNQLHLGMKENRQPLREEIEYDLDCREEANFIIMEGWAYLTDASASMESEDIYIYLANNEKRWIFRPYFERRFDIIRNTAKSECGFLGVIDKRELPKGTYQIEIGLKNRLKLKAPVRSFSINQEIEI
jgi:hypothetical protein